MLCEDGFSAAVVAGSGALLLSTSPGRPVQPTSQVPGRVRIHHLNGPWSREIPGRAAICAFPARLLIRPQCSK